MKILSTLHDHRNEGIGRANGGRDTYGCRHGGRFRDVINKVGRASDVACRRGVEYDNSATGK